MGRNNGVFGSPPKGPRPQDFAAMQKTMLDLSKQMQALAAPSYRVPGDRPKLGATQKQWEHTKRADAGKTGETKTPLPKEKGGKRELWQCPACPFGRNFQEKGACFECGHIRGHPVPERCQVSGEQAPTQAEQEAGKPDPEESLHRIIKQATAMLH